MNSNLKYTTLTEQLIYMFLRSNSILVIILTLISDNTSIVCVPSAERLKIISNLNKLIQAEDYLSLLITKAKSDYETYLIDKYLQSKDSKIFHYLKDFTKSHSLPKFLHMNSSTFDDDLDKANAFNKYFYSDFSHSSHTLPDISNLPFVSNSVSDITISLDEVHQALTTLLPRKTSGPHNIGPRVLKNCASSLTALLILAISK